MSNNELDLVKKRAEEWLQGSYDEATRQEVKKMLAGDEKELIDAFYRDLEFGTGGLRGIMGVGTNRMNIYTVGKATQGLATYLKKNFPDLPVIKVAVAHDSRNNSRLFAETTARIFAANGIKVFLFESLRPTPELSFSIRHFGCQSGVVITASHNPKEYNGYKAYWDDGGQVVPPHDKNIIKEVEKTSISEVKWEGNSQLIELVGKEVDEIYTDKIKALSLSPEAVAANNQIKIVYTPIHGTGVTLVPMVLKKYGFTNIISIPEQNIADGNFPTVKSPNPEESAAMSMAIEKAKETGAELVMATDPDADRVGIAVKNDKGEVVLLNGNQTGSILIYYLLTRWNELGKLKGKEYVVKTIVTTDLIARIAKGFNVEYFDVLTGFKYIAEIIKQNEGKKIFVGGGEESYGYLAGEFVRDKDAVMACALIAEAFAWAQSKGKTLYDILMEIYVKYGLFKEYLVNVTKKGKEGQEEIARMMESFRQNPPANLGGSKVAIVMDYQSQQTTNKITGETSVINQPKSNVLQFVNEAGDKVTVRPSGTEPKIKFYFSVSASMKDKSAFTETNAELEKKIAQITKDLGL
ncbi:MAG TPA: phospho-sugar mutase [Bacteroidales bacterium]|nr:phospho-sugar mutase [Bacteroidales bacterium]